jgi:Fanconi anemia group M protein
MQKMVKIIIDKHEKNSLVIAELAENHAEIEIKKLVVADYIIGNIAIERKTVSDFVNSMINKRLIRQLEELKQYPVKMLIIEGIGEEQLYNDNAIAGVHANAIRGMLLSILTDFQIPVLLTQDYKDTAKFIMLIAKRLENSKKHVSLRAKKKTYDIAEQQQMILEGFPGIGPATAKALLKKFKTIKAVINAPLKELEKIKKLGKKARMIKGIIDKKYKE